MAFEKLQLISVRLDPKVLRKIDEMAKKHDYYTRSSIINNLLNACVMCSNGGSLWRMVSTYSPETCGYTVDFHVDKEKLKNLPHDE